MFVGLGFSVLPSVHQLLRGKLPPRRAVAERQDVANSGARTKKGTLRRCQVPFFVFAGTPAHPRVRLVLKQANSALPVALEAL